MRHAVLCRLRAAAQLVWVTLRNLTGDDAYERYCAHAMRRHPGLTPLTRREFYDQELRRKWSGVNRCC